MIKYQRFGFGICRCREKESYSEDSRKPAVETGTLEDDQKTQRFYRKCFAISLNAEKFRRTD